MSTLKVIKFKTNNIYCVERRGLQLHLKIDKNESISIHGKLAREDSCTDSIISEGLWWGCGFQVIGMIQGTPWSDPSCIPRTNCHSIPWFLLMIWLLNICSTGNRNKAFWLNVVLHCLEILQRYYKFVILFNDLNWL